jgi:four helix bundle protein
MLNAKLQAIHQMTSDKLQSSDKRSIFDLEERTARFGESIIDFAKTLPRNLINNQLIGQIVRSGTSIGANYTEADGAESKKDFRHKIGLCKKESKETKHWLRMIKRANPDRKDDCKKLWSEAQELTLIFSSILSSSKNRNKTSP